MIYTKEFLVFSQGNTDIIDITENIEEIIVGHNVDKGQVLVFALGSTAAITTIEYEQGLIRDFKILFDKIIPKRDNYLHDNAWNDGNGHSHLRASFIGPSKVFPVINGKLAVGTWQQVVLVDFDNRARKRKIIVQVTE